MAGHLQNLTEWLQSFLLVQRRLHERQQLLNRPWEEELLHWSIDGHLHGQLAPPVDGRRRSTTSDGWCSGWAAQRRRDANPCPGPPPPG